ncbi:MAG TPA: PIN domain-containing protein [Phycisphaerae bacterium]|jgi:predicted nucleic acid-binding protein
MRILIDTNLIARLAEPDHTDHGAALQAVKGILARGDEPCVVPQVIYEFWVVATRPAAANGFGMSARQAQAEIARARKIFSLLRDERAIFQQWERLVMELDVKGKKAHDARLVAAMHRHALTHILTFNAADFARYPGITAITPDDLLLRRDSAGPSH